MMVLMDPRRMCPHCRAFITVKDRVCPYCNEAVAPRRVSRDDSSQLIGGFIPHFRFNTTIILLLNFGLYIATALFSMRVVGNGNAFMNLDSQTLALFGASSKPWIAQGEYWRLVTAGFLHGGLLHILMNSWVLFDLGAQVEEVYGSSRMLVIYFISTVGGFLASALWNFSISVGASAGLFGLIGSMIALGVRHQNPMGAAIRGMYMRWALYGIIFGLLPGFRVDNAAHIGGLAAGFGIAYLAGTPSRGAVETLWRAAGWFCVILTAASFLKMYLSFRENTRIIEHAISYTGTRSGIMLRRHRCGSGEATRAQAAEDQEVQAQQALQAVQGRQS
jgi:rhomboid protease GluP